MEMLKNATILCLLVMGMLMPVVQAKSPTILLKEGIYAEETEGDLDKAIGIYEQVLEEAAETERLAGRAAYQLGICHLKKGETDVAAEYFRKVIKDYSSQKGMVTKAKGKLQEIAPAFEERSLFEQIDGQVIRFISEKYGEIAGEAGKEILYANSHIYYVNSDFVLYNGGMGFYYNWTGKVITGRTRLSGTSFPNQSHYGIEGHELNTEIVPDTTRKNHWQIYWIPDEPLEPEESLYYGWSIDSSRNLPSKTGQVAELTMQNTFGSPAIETFFLVLPKGLKISKSNPPTGSKELLGFNVYWWTKTVQQNENHLEQVQLNKGDLLTEDLDIGPAPWVDGEVMELKLKRPGGKEYGTIIYSGQSSIIDDIETWQIVSHMHVTAGSVSQYTFVEAEAETFAPFVGQTTNWMGEMLAEYTPENVTLTSNGTAKDYPVSTVVYDNEQALYLIRRMPLAEDYQGKFPIFAVQGGGTIVECRIKVLAVEDVTVSAGTYTCYKTELSIHYGGVVTLQHILWFSADEHKYLVKYDVGGAATMELAKIWQHQKDKPLTYKNKKKGFSASVPADWRFYRYGSALHLMAPDLKPWALLTWQNRGTDPDSASALTIAKADAEKLKDSFTEYTVDPTSWTELTLSGLQAAQYIATYQEEGTGFKTHPKPKDMIEYRTYIVDESTVYWFVFRIEQDYFEGSRDALDYIITSFKANEKI
jgi:hypothetical protein